MLEKYVDSLYKELKNKLPGKEVQYKMAPFNHPKNMPFADDSVDAAVLLFIYPKNKSIYTLLIQRANYEGIHSGQISLPGGKYETKDKNFKQTALRETHEEIGINPSEIEIIGQLSPLHIPVSNFNVYPFIGYSKKNLTFFPTVK
ncbi:MAG: CoA pyrophosphatase [Bacteroidales bacterium]|jgi:8-oxo-dGTP pyrophosphatase MutT (NUDIX family)|nr:CoA pyrophosphatase [Bacteroidales bacterium]